MTKHVKFTHITPLPSHVTREVVTTLLHDHSTMITANPLVTHHGRCTPPPHALPDEQESAWYEITDKVEYVPGTSFTGSVTYTACLHDLPKGLQSHIHAPMGLEIRSKWQVLGWIPGEEREPIEIGADQYGVPREGLYLREDCDLKCNILLLPIVKRNIKKSHKTLVDRIIERTEHLMPPQHQALQRPSSLTFHQRTNSDLDRSVSTTLSSRPSMSSLGSRPMTRTTPDRETPEPSNDEYPPIIPSFHDLSRTSTPTSVPMQYNEWLQRIAFDCQMNGYSVSISGGTQENARSSQASPLNQQNLRSRGRSQSPGRKFLPDPSKYKRYLSENTRHRAGSPASLPSTRYASPVRSSSRNTRYASSMSSRMPSRQGTPEPGVGMWPAIL
ncbi:hypothetical protein BGW36DRAFT_389037 [Talaromyces proteolyticus]|uniref:DUF7053 domain-containing protein n=1 Tax=Talaromyces proteolyticus TaxID=1131652 RepID=A0AAD4KGH2_9EURO|nr:uncharacterized protein BGW36DRAFT_389037 [Talaromyces proteolyticus]KAH8690605.1 hypothetical protein BGW36DRAFT_389037 [Talaromyces proteolyticus]